MPGRREAFSPVKGGGGVPNSNTANGTQPVIWDCHGAANQLWTRR